MAYIQAIPGVSAEALEELVLSALARNPIVLEPRERRWKGLDLMVQAGLVQFVESRGKRAYHITEKGLEVLRAYQDEAET